MKPTILAIHASERDGNTHVLLEQAILGAEEAGARVERIVVREKIFSPCTACEMCSGTGVCVINDDMTEIYRALTQNDHVIVAAPIYFWSLPGRFKCLIDRCQAFWYRKFILRKPVAANPSGTERLGAFLSCCGHADGDRIFPYAEKTIRAFFNCLDMRLQHTLYAPNTDSAGDILKGPNLLKQARVIGGCLAKPADM